MPRLLYIYRPFLLLQQKTFVKGRRYIRGKVLPQCMDGRGLPRALSGFSRHNADRPMCDMCLMIRRKVQIIYINKPLLM